MKGEKKYIEGSDRLPHIPLVYSKQRKTKTKLVPDKESSKKWGFPVYFPPVVDTMRLKEQQEQQQDRKRRRQEKKDAIVRVQRDKQRRRQETQEDYDVYLHFASKYGPLDALLYVCTERPGIVYRIIVNRASRLIQIWLKERMIALRMSLAKSLARNIVVEYETMGIQKIQDHLEQENRVQCNLRRILHQNLVHCFTIWTEQVRKAVGAKGFLKRILRADLQRKFTCWKTKVETIKAVREGKVTQASVRLFRRNLYLKFKTWTEFTHRSKRIKDSAAKKVGHRKQELFTRWQLWVPWHRLATVASILIQKIARGCLVRFRIYKRDRSAVLIQRVYRGFVARRETKRLRVKIAQADGRVRKDRVDAVAAAYAQLCYEIEQDQLTEEERNRLEVEYIDDQVGRNQKAVAEGMTKILPNKFKTMLQKRIKLKKKQIQDAGGYMKTAEATEQAREEVLAEQKAVTIEVARNAFRETNPPICFCSICFQAFSRQSFLERHACGHTVEQQASIREEIQQQLDLQHQIDLDRAQQDPVPYASLQKYLE